VIHDSKSTNKNWITNMLEGLHKEIAPTPPRRRRAGKGEMGEKREREEETAAPPAVQEDAGDLVEEQVDDQEKFSQKPWKNVKFPEEGGEAEVEAPVMVMSRMLTKAMLEEKEEPLRKIGLASSGKRTRWR
jgi:hypothetical protein